MHERRDAERRESRLKGYRKERCRTGEIQNGRNATVDRRDKGQLGGRKGGMQDWRESELKGFRTGGIQDWRGFEKEGRQERRNVGK